MNGGSYEAVNHEAKVACVGGSANSGRDHNGSNVWWENPVDFEESGREAGESSKGCHGSGQELRVLAIVKVD